MSPLLFNVEQEEDQHLDCRNHHRALSRPIGIIIHRVACFLEVVILGLHYS